MGSRLDVTFKAARLIGLTLFTIGVTACGARHAAGPTIELGRPGPADPQSARLVATTGNGAHRITLWTARNSAGDICPGWRLGTGGSPAAFHCQRQGLERPVLWVQGGGGKGTSVDWGGDVGLVAPGVTRVEADEKPLPLRPAPHLPGWRVFATGGSTPPLAELAVYAGERQLLDDGGLWINPDGIGCECSRNATGWSGTHAYVPEQQRGTDAHALDVALALPALSKILVAHGPGWIDEPERWGRCTDGATIGAVVNVELWHQARFFATLPFKNTGVTGTHSAYVTGVHRVLAQGSTGLQIWVDTHTWRVVGVATAFDQGIEIPLGTVRDPVPGGGYDDPAQCPKGD